MPAHTPFQTPLQTRFQTPAHGALSLAKRRSARRERGAGAALFVVSMTISVLASVGLYALAAASSEVKTSGFERQNTQTHYLASYGTLGAAHEIVSSKAQFYMGLMMTTPDSCPGSLPGVPTTASILTRACRRLGASELAINWTGIATTDAYAGTVPYQSGQTPGSFGPTPTQGDFFVELTEPIQANPPAQYGLNLNFCFIELTVSATGITRPLFPVTPQYTQTFGSEGLEMQRSRILAGPVSCPR
jgi:hypothetical protein